MRGGVQLAGSTGPHLIPGLLLPWCHRSLRPPQGGGEAAHTSQALDGAILSWDSDPGGLSAPHPCR